MRAQLLEDPSAPSAWVGEGLERAASLGLCAPEDSARLREILDGAPVAFAHGDLLPRNVLLGAGGVALVDWETAGAYLAGWDRAVLWVGVPAARPLLEPAADARTWALVAFALLRELKYARQYGAKDTPGERRVRAEWAEVRERWAG
jgi:hypothetical protein